MRIGIFTDIYKPDINGVTTSIETFREQLEKRGHEVFIFAPNVTGAIKEKNVFRLPSLAIEDITPPNVPIGIPILPIINKVIKPLKLDVIHTQLPFLVGYLGHHAAERLNLPEVHTYHSHLTEYSHYAPSQILQPIVKYGLKRLSRSFCNKSDIVIAPSSSIKDLLLNYGVKSPIIINPTGINLKNFKRLDKTDRNKLFTKYSIPKDKKILLFGGRIAEEKNLIFLLHALKIIVEDYPECFLIIAGGGPNEKTIKKAIIKMKLQGRAIVTGYLAKEEIAKFFGSADIFTFPSLTETQGLVLCEAMASQTPVVAINELGPKDIVTNGIDGYLTKNDLADFSQTVLNLLENEPLRKTIAKATQKNVERFSIENRTNRLIEIYEQAILLQPKEKKISFWQKLIN
jgi:glycosyltransferase involved in cell wall biosynthesis